MAQAATGHNCRPDLSVKTSAPKRVIFWMASNCHNCHRLFSQRLIGIEIDFPAGIGPHTTSAHSGRVWGKETRHKQFFPFSVERVQKQTKSKVLQLIAIAVFKLSSGLTFSTKEQRSQRQHPKPENEASSKLFGARCLQNFSCLCLGDFAACCVPAWNR